MTVYVPAHAGSSGSRRSLRPRRPGTSRCRRRPRRRTRRRGDGRRDRHRRRRRRGRAPAARRWSATLAASTSSSASSSSRRASAMGIISTPTRPTAPMRSSRGSTPTAARCVRLGLEPVVDGRPVVRGVGPVRCRRAGRDDVVRPGPLERVCRVRGIAPVTSRASWPRRLTRGTSPVSAARIGGRSPVRFHSGVLPELRVVVAEVGHQGASAAQQGRRKGTGLHLSSCNCNVGATGPT